jgi:predicted RND superfamily exporter protein
VHALDAVREAGAGTGGALLLSALSSIIGFAPMPAFAWFGQLAAVMIFLSVAVALIVLPSLFVMVTPKQRTDQAFSVPAPEVAGVTA